MKVINAEELAILLYETHQALLSSEDRVTMGIVCSWDEEAEFNRDDFRKQAQLILKKARVALI